MKAFLMYRNRDFDLEQKLPWNEADLVQDLGLETLFDAMASGDPFIFRVCREALLVSTVCEEEILYRQAILKDCLKNAAVVREIFRIPAESEENKHRQWLYVLSHYPRGILSSSVEMMKMFVVLLKKLRHIAEDHAGEFESEGFRRFFAMITGELDDDYFAIVNEELNELGFSKGLLISANFWPGNEGTKYTLRKPNPGRGWLKELFSPRVPAYSFSIDARDDAGMRALSDLEDQGVNFAANALAQSADHIDSFFVMLKTELAFYVGCLNLQDRLNAMQCEVAFPELYPVTDRRQHFEGLYDLCLALTKGEKITGNEIDADGKDLVLITGANQGGKSTFLRSIGLAQLMMQCGMFVPAQRFVASLCQGIYTHYKRQEDASMNSGKFDEELARMSRIADALTVNSLVLFNESFSATNELEGSEIASQITKALVDRQVKVFFVTHQYEFAHRFYQAGEKSALFLRAERQDGGKRTFRLEVGEPLPTSFGADVYLEVFGKDS